MKILVQNFRGCKTATIEHEKLTMIAGKNHDGKSSFYQAARAVLTGEVFPMPGITKTKIKKIIRDGEKTAACKITVGESSAGISWPDCKSFREGKEVPLLSKVAAGSLSLLDIAKKDRPGFMGDYLMMKPTNDELSEALIRKNVTKEMIGKLIDNLEINGWDTMYARSKEAGQRLKGQWQGVTGENFGTRKINDWFPAKYYVALGSRTTAELDTALAEAIANWEAAIAADTVAGLEVEQIKTAAASLESVLKDQKQHAARLAEIANELEIEQRSQNKLSEMPEELACPHCGGIVQHEGGKLVEYRALTDTEVTDRTESLRQSHDKAAELKTDLEAVRERNFKLLDAVRYARSATAKLKEIEAGEAAGEWQGKTEEARQAVDNARDEKEAWTQKKEADKLSANLVMNLAIQAVLNPKGLRREVATRQIGAFNALLSKASKAALWAEVQVDDDFMVSHGGRPVEICSRSECYQARIIVQTALSKREEAAHIMIDDCDIIVGPERNGIFQLIKWAGIPAIVFMAMPNKKQVPDLSTINGVSYWVADGEIEKCQN